MGLGQLYISLETSVLCEDWIYRGNIDILSETDKPCGYKRITSHYYPQCGH